MESFIAIFLEAVNYGFYGAVVASSFVVSALLIMLVLCLAYKIVSIPFKAISKLLDD